MNAQSSITHKLVKETCYSTVDVFRSIDSQKKFFNNEQAKLGTQLGNKN